MKTIKTVMFLFVCAVLLSACLARVNNPELPSSDNDQKDWQTYNNAKYHFTIQLPPTWRVVELPTAEYPAITNQIWFLSESLPQPQTDSKADITFIFTQVDLSSEWDAQYFDNYQLNTIQLGTIQAKRISGTNKESKYAELVVLAKIGDAYFQALSNQSEASLKYFDALISTLRFTGSIDNTTFTPTVIPSASIKPTSEPACFVTGFAPVAFMPDGSRILVRAEKGIQVFNLQTMEEEEFLDAPTGVNLSAVALSPDGKILAWALDDLSIQLIRISDKKLLHTLDGHSDIIGKLNFSPNGDLLFSASHDTWVRIWDMQGNLVHAFQPTGAQDFPGEVLGIGISPDGTMLASIPFDGPVKLWNLTDYQLIRELGGYGGFDTSDIAFSPDGQLVASDTASGLYLWKTSDGTELLGGNPGINSMAMAFSPDGRFLAYGETGEQFNIVLSSPDGARKLRLLEGSPSPVGIVLFSPDSSLLMSSDWVETRIWRTEDGQLTYTGKSACP